MLNAKNKQYKYLYTKYKRITNKSSNQTDNDATTKNNIASSIVHSDFSMNEKNKYVQMIIQSEEKAKKFKVFMCINTYNSNYNNFTK